MQNSEDLKYWIKLLSTKNIGHIKARNLVTQLGSPKYFLKENPQVLMESDIVYPSDKENLLTDKIPENYDTVLNIMHKYNINFVSILDENYPPLLKDIFDAPLYLFYRGSFQPTDFRRSFAIVGTRKATSYGKMAVSKIGKELAQHNFTIVSGLAYGIDTIAHKSALEANGRTIAVLATGCEQIYPPQNQKLAEQIIENGAIVSELLPGANIEKWNFPKRNRIISGLSIGTWVVEGLKNSGAMLTSKFALEQNREVFTLPGNINRPESEGPNYLLKLGAKPVTSAQDILEEFNIFDKEDEPLPFPELTSKEKYVYDIIFQSRKDLFFDELLMLTNLEIGELSTIILMLEMKSIIKRTNGNKITKVI